MRITFLASLPPIQSALSVSGNESGGRLKLDIPESELAEAIKVMLWRGKCFRVTLELDDNA